MRGRVVSWSMDRRLARGLHLLVAMNDVETATISGLVKETNLPKATVVRLLKALQAEGYAT
jgi:DNA-binding IclR family transcriptional regulator